MGTNFYTSKKERTHIGKRSAAGMYCWDCGVSLCKRGAKYVHHGPSRGVRHHPDGHVDWSHYQEDHDLDWHKVCPKCGKAREEEADGGTGFRELGFNKTTPRKKTGVASCSSFSWAIAPESWPKLCRCVWDEYGRKYTKAEFRQVLEECPIQFTELIGRDFS